MDFQLLQYNAWESQQLIAHSALLEKYNSLKQKEGMMIEAKEGKVNRKDVLLTFKANNTISKLGNAELENIEKEDVIQGNYNRNMFHITSTKAASLKTLDDKYEADIASLKAAYEAKRLSIEEKATKAELYYNSEKDASLAKTKREYDSKKRTLEARGECIQQEKSLSVKSAAEITLEKTKYDILKQLKSSIDRIDMSRSQLPPNTSFNTVLPTLPEPLIAPSQPLVAVAPVTITPSNSNDMPSWLANCGEDASTAILREEARREDARLRREAAEEEMQRQERALAYRRQLDQEAEERRKRNDESRRLETAPQIQDVSDSEMSDGEMQSYIASRKIELDKIKRGIKA
jgi:hypothetical protein